MGHRYGFHLGPSSKLRGPGSIPVQGLYDGGAELEDFGETYCRNPSYDPSSVHGLINLAQQDDMIGVASSLGQVRCWKTIAHTVGNPGYALQMLLTDPRILLWLPSTSRWLLITLGDAYSFSV